MSKKRPIFFGFLMVVAVILYFPGLEAEYYSDDFKFVFDQPSSRIFSFFAHENQHLAMYRPLQSSFMAIVQTFFGLKTLPIHLLTLLLHTVCAYFVYIAAIELDFSPLASILSPIYMLVSQANAMAVLGNDTLSQVGGTLFGFLALWFFYRGYSTQGSKAKTKYVLSLLFFVFSLLFKETGLTFLLAISITPILFRPSVQKTIFSLAPYYLVAFLFLLARFAIVSAQPDNRYDVVFGLNVFANTAMLFFSSVLPISSVSTYVAFIENNIAFLSAALFSSAAVAFVLMVGLYEQRHSKGRWLLLGVIFATLLPLAFLRHVSELYTYNAMPAIALLFGVGASRLWAYSRKQRPLEILAICLCAFLYSSHAYAVHKKAELSEANGRRASALIRDIEPNISAVPHNGTLVLLNPKTSQTEYSVFLINGFNVLNFGTNILKHISKRDDFEIWISSETGSFKAPPNSIVLALIDDRVSIWKQPD